MGHRDAVRHNIPIRKDARGYNWYYPPCEYCGTPVASWSYIPTAKYVCGECRKILIERKLSETAEQKQKRLDTAIKRVAKVADIKLYGRGIAWVQENLDKKNWFQSTEEIMVAIELIRRGVIAHHQVSVFDYSVDFVLPEMKVVLEIDGAIYHGDDKKHREALRDELITNKLGDGYELIRIRTDYINENITRLLPAIKAVLSRRKRKECT